MPAIKKINFVPSIKIFYYSYKNIALFITAIKRFMPAKKKLSVYILKKIMIYNLCKQL